MLPLDMSFRHPARGQEGKDGKPMNEARILCASILQDGGVLLADKRIELEPVTPVPGSAVGDEIRLTEADSVASSDTHPAAVERALGA